MQAIKESTASRQRLIALLLVLLLAFAVVLRVIHLGAESLWLDEASSVTLARLPPADIIDLVAREDVHPPLYYLALHYWVMLTRNDSEWGVRLLSVLVAALSILLVYRVASLIFDPWTGILSALLLSVSQLHIMFSQEARMYALLCLLALLSFYFFIRWLRGASGLTFAAYVVTTALLPYTQVYGWFVIAAENLFFLSLYLISKETFKRGFKRWVLAQALVAALFLPWVPVMMQQVSRVQQSFWIPAPSLHLLAFTLNEYLFSNSLQWIHLLLITLCVISHWRFNHKEAVADSRSSSDAQKPLVWFSDRVKIYLLLVWLLVPILAPFALSYFTRPIFLPKYTIAALPAFVILAARGLMSISFVPARLFLVALILFLSWSGLQSYWHTQRKTDWRTAVGYFNQMAKPDDLVLFYPSFGQVPFDYYLSIQGVQKAPFPDPGAEATGDKGVEMLRARVKGHERVWLVIHSFENETTLLLKKHLGDMYNLRAQDILPGIEVYLYEGRKTG